MVSHTERWIPEEVLCDDQLTDAIQGHAVSWASDWFPGSIPVRTSLNVAASQAANSPEPHFVSGGCGVYLPEVDQLALAKALLGMDRGDTEDSDREIFGSVTKSAVDDLLARFGSDLFEDKPRASSQPGSASEPGAAKVRYTLTLGAPSIALILEMPRSRAVEARCRLVAPRKARLPLHDPAVALADLQVELGAQLGQVELSVPEVRQLAPGDVVILDRAVEDPMEVVIERSVSTGLRCRLQTNADALQLTLINPAAS